MEYRKLSETEKNTDEVIDFHLKNWLEGMTHPDYGDPRYFAMSELECFDTVGAFDENNDIQGLRLYSAEKGELHSAHVSPRLIGKGVGTAMTRKAIEDIIKAQSVLPVTINGTSFFDKKWRDRVVATISEYKDAKIGSFPMINSVKNGR